MLHLQVVQVVTFIIAFTLAATRILSASRSWWSVLPTWLAGILPSLIVAVPALGQAVVGAQTWTDLTVAFLTAGALLLPGAHSHTVEVKPPNGPGAGVAAICLALALPFGVAACASLGPLLAQVASDLADGANVLDAVAAAVSSWFAVHPDAAKQAKIEQQIADCRLALSSAAHATSGAQDLDAGKADEAFDRFRVSYLELMRLLQDAGVGAGSVGGRMGASRGEVALPTPIALRHFTK